MNFSDSELCVEPLQSIVLGPVLVNGLNVSSGEDRRAEPWRRGSGGPVPPSASWAPSPRGVALPGGCFPQMAERQSAELKVVFADYCKPHNLLLVVLVYNVNATIAEASVQITSLLVKNCMRS